MKALFAAKRISIFLLRIKKAFVLSILFLSFTTATAQGDMRFFGTATKDKKPLSGAVVTIYRGSEKITELTTGKNGKFKYLFDIGVEYKMTFSYPGCVNMFMMLNLKVPNDKMGIFPDYATEVPFFEITNTDINLTKYKQPFAKVIFDGNLGFWDDPNYNFKEGLLIDKALLARLEAEKKAKLEAEAKAKSDAEAKLLAERRAKEEQERKAAEAQARADAEELARLKAEAEKQTNEKVKESMETEIIRLEREKQAKALLEKKNREIKAKYENDLLKMVAENERTAKVKEFAQQKDQAVTNTVIETMRRKAEIKAKADNLREKEKEKAKQTLVNRQLQVRRIKGLVEAAAVADRGIRITTQKSLPGVKDFKLKPKPNVGVSTREDLFKDVIITTVTFEGELDTYRQETYFWGSRYYYKNDVEMDEKAYKEALSVYVKNN